MQKLVVVLCIKEPDFFFVICATWRATAVSYQYIVIPVEFGTVENNPAPSHPTSVS